MGVGAGFCVPEGCKIDIVSVDATASTLRTATVPSQSSSGIPRERQIPVRGSYSNRPLGGIARNELSQGINMHSLALEFELSDITPALTSSINPETSIRQNDRKVSDFLTNSDSSSSRDLAELDKSINQNSNKNIMQIPKSNQINSPPQSCIPVQEHP